MNLSPNAADVVFLVLEVYQEEMSGDLLMNVQKCQLSDGVAVRSSSNFRLTCPVSEVYKLQNPKFSPQLKKEVLEVRQRSILRFSQSLQLNASNHFYQLQARRNDNAAKLRQEIQKGMSLKAARTFTIRLGLADLRHDLELLGLAIENSFKVEKPKNRLADLDPLLGKNWDIKLKQDDRFLTAFSHNVRKVRVVKYIVVYDQIKATDQKYCHNQKRQRKLEEISFRKRGFGDNLDEFWLRYSRVKVLDLSRVVEAYL